MGELQRGLGVIRPTGLIVAFEKVVQRDDRSIRDDKIYKRRELPFELRLRFRESLTSVAYRSLQELTKSGVEPIIERGRN